MAGPTSLFKSPNLTFGKAGAAVILISVLETPRVTPVIPVIPVIPAIPVVAVSPVIPVNTPSYDHADRAAHPVFVGCLFAPYDHIEL